MPGAHRATECMAVTPEEAPGDADKENPEDPEGQLREKGSVEELGPHTTTVFLICVQTVKIGRERGGGPDTGE